MPRPRKVVGRRFKPGAGDQGIRKTSSEGAKSSDRNNPTRLADNTPSQLKTAPSLQPIMTHKRAPPSSAISAHVIAAKSSNRRKNPTRLAEDAPLSQLKTAPSLQPIITHKRAPPSLAIPTPVIAAKSSDRRKVRQDLLMLLRYS
jgi:hypothetical protein